MRIAIALTMFAAALLAGDLSNRRAPGFSLPDLETNQHDLYDHRGKVVLLEILKTDCPACSRVSSTLKQVVAKYGDRVAVLGIVVPPDNQTTVRSYSLRHALTYPLLFDCGQVTGSYLKAGPANPRITLPHLFLIDRQGTIRDDWSGEAADLSLEALSAKIDPLTK
jgi:peroxiredoxin